MPVAQQFPSEDAANRADKPAVCASVGPYADKAKAEAATTRLKAASIDSEIQEVEAVASNRHWVILPPQSSRERAAQLLRELQARKIDSFLISSGELTNAISLGVFAREELAADFRGKIRAAGYPAEIRKKEPQKKEFWVRISPGQAVENAKKVLSSPSSGLDGIKFSNTVCETFAQHR